MNADNKRKPHRVSQFVTGQAGRVALFSPGLVTPFTRFAEMKPQVLRVILAALLRQAGAWTTCVPPCRSSRLSSSSTSAARRVAISAEATDSSESGESRREFFEDLAVRAGSFSLAAAAVGSSVIASPDSAIAMDSTTPYSKVYMPAPHSMDGKIVVITGGNTGLGLESVKRLSEAGANVIFTTRDQTKGQLALDEVNRYLSGKDTIGKASYVNLDLCDLDNVKSFRNRLEGKIGDAKIDVLMNK